MYVPTCDCACVQSDIYPQGASVFLCVCLRCIRRICLSFCSHVLLHVHLFAYRFALEPVSWWKTFWWSLQLGWCLSSGVLRSCTAGSGSLGVCHGHILSMVELACFSSPKGHKLPPLFRKCGVEKDVDKKMSRSQTEFWFHLSVQLVPNQGINTICLRLLLYHTVLTEYLKQNLMLSLFFLRGTLSAANALVCCCHSF